MVDVAARPHPNRTLAALALACVAYSIMQAFVMPALPAIQRGFDAGESGVAWVFTAFVLAASVGTPIVGRLGDMFGKERWLMISLLGYGAGTLLAALAPSLGVLIVARALQGMAGGIFPLAFSIVHDELPRERVSGTIGALAAITGVGAVTGAVLGGPVVDALGWRWLFWLTLPSIALAAAVTWRWVPESPVRRPGRVNWQAALLMAGGLSAIMIAISETTSWGWTAPRTLALLALGLAVIGAWIAVELRSAEPLVDMRMMRLPAVWTLNLSALLIGAGMYTAFLAIPQLAQLPPRDGFGFGTSATGGALFLLPGTLAMLACSVLAGRLAVRFGAKTALVAGGIGVAACYALLLMAHDTPAPVYVASGLLGGGTGLAFAALGMLIVSAAPVGQTGVAAGMNAVLRTAGGAVGAQVGATFVAAGVVDGLPTVDGFNAAFVAMLLVAALGTLAALAVPGRGRAAAGASDAGAAPPEARPSEATQQPRDGAVIGTVSSRARRGAP